MLYFVKLQSMIEISIFHNGSLIIIHWPMKWNAFFLKRIRSHKKIMQMKPIEGIKQQLGIIYLLMKHWNEEEPSWCMYVQKQEVNLFNSIYRYNIIVCIYDNRTIPYHKVSLKIFIKASDNRVFVFQED